MGKTFVGELFNYTCDLNVEIDVSSHLIQLNKFKNSEESFEWIEHYIQEREKIKEIRLEQQRIDSQEREERWRQATQRMFVPDLDLERWEEISNQTKIEKTPLIKNDEIVTKTKNINKTKVVFVNI